MNPIKILTKSHQPLCLIDDYESLIVQRKFNGYGEFQMKMNRHKNNTEYLEVGNIIYIARNKAAIIFHKEISVDDKGKGNETILVKGYTLDYLFNNRIILPVEGKEVDEITGDAETVIKHYIERCLTNPTHSCRKIDWLEIAPNLNRGKDIQWESRYKILSKEIQSICSLADLGVFIDLDSKNKKWIVDVYEGRDLSVNQSINPPVIFSHDFDNIKSQKLTLSNKGYKTTGYVGGKGEGNERQLEIVGDEKIGIDRIETFINASNSNNLILVGEEKLKGLCKTKTLEGQVLKTGPFVYEKDWNLGDIVTIQNKDWNVTMDTRITEVKEIYENGKIGLDIVFGNKIPTLTDKLDQQLEQMSGEITK